ncbi:maltose operon protein MalM [Enterobacter asburiae]|uniref:maltose operon protein MalM n=1 Tax=Enterobacter asburiae TaxID=61645 RepID=UPI0018C33C38|nr:maltose operon protein MalM [Enterobacter asburiae]MBG0640383.1 maltose operon protein MalM [Enterobacter asburiae]MDS1915599.1 maltose operon protein MalM [Enterobacter asburiae]
MTMKKSLLALCLTAGMFAALPAVSLADVNIVPQNTTAAPAIPSATLQSLNWVPVNVAQTQTIELGNTGQTLNVPGISGPVAAWSVPANVGELTLTLVSEADKTPSVFAPNVLVLDQNMSPSAFFPSSYFTYQKPGVMSADRLEGVLKLTPALGQQKIYILAFTTPEDLQRTTKMIDPAKSYAQGAGNAIPDIPDPVARHVTNGTLKLKVQTNTSSSILVGPLFGSSGPAAVTVGNTAAPAPAYTAPAATAAAPVAAAAPAPAKKAEPVLNDTEEYFNNAIKQAVKRGDVDKALKLLDEAERLGSTTARSTFISSVKGKG